MFWKSRRVEEIIYKFETDGFIQWDKEAAENKLDRKKIMFHLIILMTAEG